jgi:tetratricopeptide (TPR) repeat protein
VFIAKKGERDVDFSSAVGALHDLSLITKEVEEDKFSIHRLVQLSIHAWLEQHHQKVYYSEHALQMLAEKSPREKYETDRGQTCVALYPHVQAILQYRYISESSMESLGDLLHKISLFDLQQGRYDLAYARIPQAYDLGRKLRGEDDCDTLARLSLLGLTAKSQGKYKAAEECFWQALGGQKKVLGMEHEDTLATILNLASVLNVQGEYQAAEKMTRQALRGFENIHGAEHPPD